MTSGEAAIRTIQYIASSDLQSILNPAGSQAHAVENLWWVFFWISAAVYVLVLAFLAVIIWRRKPRSIAEEPVELPARGSRAFAKQERRLTFAVATAVGATVVILFVLLFTDFITGRNLHALSAEANPLVVKVTGQQWWWEVRYEDPVTSNIFTSANDMHLPVGRPVKLELESKDVIHSFWIPNLSGKRDMIPGYTSMLWLKADKPGNFIGQCAEFCGHQHAHMRFTVTTEPPEKFEQWLQAQRQPAPAPTTPSQKRGQEVFLTSTCVMCHTIGGTIARSTIGPSLTHLASRPTIAAGTLKNTRGNLAGWILDPQHVKPGTKMPQNNLPPEDFQALLDYLESLR